MPATPTLPGATPSCKDLHDALNTDSATALTQGHAISGLGGIGKTQTAVEYTYRYRSEYQYIFWIRADTEVALQAGFVEIAKLLDLPEKDATNPAETVQAVKHWLEHSGKWLLIFDNADEPELLKAYYPRTPRGHILLTSRAQLFDTLGIARPLALEKMDPEEALDFLFKRTARAQSDPAEKNAAEQLAAELGYLPLALEQAAAYISSKDSTLSRLSRQLPAAAPVTAQQSAAQRRRVPGVGRQHLGAQLPGSRKRPGRSRCAAGERLPESRCHSAGTADQGASRLGPVLAEALATSEDPLVLNEALEPLTRYSLIRLDVDTQTYSIHRMVQEVVKDQMGVELQAEWAERVVRAVEQSFPEVDYDTWPRCERYIPHALLCATHIDHWSMIFREARNLLLQAGYYFYQRGQYREAEPLWKSVQAICEQVLGPEHPTP